MDDAVLTGVETRTSSPVRIKRGDNFQSINIKVCIRQAKVRAMRAAFSLLRWMALKSPKQLL